MQRLLIIPAVLLLGAIGFFYYLGTPTKLNAAAVSSSQIDLSWHDNSSGESGFKIEMSIDNKTFNKIAEAGPNLTSYSVAGLLKNTSYYFRIRSFKIIEGKERMSGYSRKATSITFDTLPLEPSLLTVEPVSSTVFYLGLKWQDNSDNEKGFKIERSQDGANFSEISVTNAETTGFEDYAVNATAVYYYRVKAFNDFGSSPYSNVFSTFTYNNSDSEDVPVAPSFLEATFLGSSTTLNRINLTWQDNSSNEDTFVLEKSFNNKSFFRLKTFEANYIGYNDYEIDSSTTYYYRVQAFNEWGGSGYSNVSKESVPGSID